MEIRRFGIGHRRKEGPPGTRGVTGQAIHSDDRGVVAELAFAPRAAMTSHSNPNTTLFIVIEGGGFVQVGDERRRIAAGEAAVWPAHVEHAAWTDLTPMRAFVVEFAGDAETGAPALLLDGTATRLSDAAAAGANSEVAPGSSDVPAAPEAERAIEREGDGAGRGSAAERADGRLAPRPLTPESSHTSVDREPW